MRCFFFLGWVSVWWMYCVSSCTFCFCSAIILGACKFCLESVFCGEEAVSSHHWDESHDIWSLLDTTEAQHWWTKGKPCYIWCLHSYSISALSCLGKINIVSSVKVLGSTVKMPLWWKNVSRSVVMLDTERLGPWMMVLSLTCLLPLFLYSTTYCKLSLVFEIVHVYIGTWYPAVWHATLHLALF